MENNIVKEFTIVLTPFYISLSISLFIFLNYPNESIIIPIILIIGVSLGIIPIKYYESKEVKHEKQ